MMFHLSLPIPKALQMLPTACLIQRAISLISRSKSQEAWQMAQQEKKMHLLSK